MKENIIINIEAELIVHKIKELKDGRSKYQLWIKVPAVVQKTTYLTIDNIKAYPYEIEMYVDIIKRKGIQYARKNHNKNGFFYKDFCIWESDSFLDINDWIDDIIADNPELDRNEEEITEIMCNTNFSYLEDERVNLNMNLGQPILVIGDLGLWNGRVQGYKEIESGNIKDCLYSDNPENRWYVSPDGEFRCESHHHDGVSYYRYRVWKKDVSFSEKDDLLDLLQNGKVPEAKINKLTEPLGPIIANIYGWQLNL